MEPKYKRVVVKIGSNVLTSEGGTLNTTQLSALVDQIVELHRSSVEVIVVSSGAVAAGRNIESSLNKSLDAISQRQLFSAIGQVKLINKYYNLFQDHSLLCAQVLTTKESFSSRTHYLNQQHCIGTMLSCSVVPIINENDTISITELMFTDNDELSGLVATMMDADALIILSNIDGIYDGDPANSDSQVIRNIDHSQDNLEQYISASRSQFGRGGMLTKSRISSKVADQGIEVIIANGKRPNILTDLILTGRDVVSTRFSPSPHSTSSVKRWIAHSDGFAKGIITINQKAREALLSSTATSLLPIGVTKVEGDFEKGDIVKVVSLTGEKVAIGRIWASSYEAREQAGERGHKPLIHYDYLYIEEQ